MIKSNINVPRKRTNGSGSAAVFHVETNIDSTRLAIDAPPAGQSGLYGNSIADFMCGDQAAYRNDLA